MTYRLSWLADVLRATGQKVTEVGEWKTRGRSDMPNPRGVMIHHTGGPPEGNAPSLNLIVNGRPDLAGPLSQLVLGRDGTWFVVAAGRCNHAGAGSWQGIVGGNTSFIGIEAENAGTPEDVWPATQMAALEAGTAAILKAIGAGKEMAVGHREFALPRGRKIDPLFDMAEFREKVAAIMNGEKPTRASVPPMKPARVMLSRGDQGRSVRMLQAALRVAPKGATADLHVDGAFGGKTDTALRAYQRANGLVVDGKAGPKTWASLGF